MNLPPASSRKELFWALRPDGLMHWPLEPAPPSTAESIQPHHW